MSDQATHPTGQTVAEIVQQARETTGPTLAERQAVHAGHPEGQPGGCRAADLSLAAVMADFEPTDRARQEYEALVAAYTEGQASTRAEIEQDARGNDQRAQAETLLKRLGGYDARSPVTHELDIRRAAKALAAAAVAQSREGDQQAHEHAALVKIARMVCSREMTGEPNPRGADCQCFSCTARKALAGEPFLDRGALAAPPPHREGKTVLECDQCGFRSDEEWWREEDGKPVEVGDRCPFHYVPHSMSSRAGCDGVMRASEAPPHSGAEGPQSQEGVDVGNGLHCCNCGDAIPPGREVTQGGETMCADCANPFDAVVRQRDEAEGDLSQAREDLDTLRATCASQQAIIAALPKTADGVPIVPGMTVYGPAPCLPGILRCGCPWRAGVRGPDLRSGEGNAIPRCGRRAGGLEDAIHGAAPAARREAEPAPVGLYHRTGKVLMMDKPHTPMVDRAIKLEPVNLEIMRFLKWLAHKKGLVLCRSSFDPHATDPTAWRPIPMRDHEGLVADFQGIDLAQVAKERKALVKWANSRVMGDGLGEGRQPGD